MKTKKFKTQLIEDYIAILNIDNFNMSIKKEMNKINANDKVFKKVENLDRKLKVLYEEILKEHNMMDLSILLLKKEIYSSKFPINQEFFLRFATEQNQKNLKILQEISNRIKEETNTISNFDEFGIEHVNIMQKI
ncbi:MAG: hypothetical protein ACI4L6_01520 [Candidatus Onthoplasma sp.]